jgi:hypothetical protein
MYPNVATWPVSRQIVDAAVGSSRRTALPVKTKKAPGTNVRKRRNLISILNPCKYERTDFLRSTPISSQFNLTGEFMEKCYLCGADTESSLDGGPKCPKCGAQNEPASPKASESEKPTTKLLGNTALIVGR